jgi:hypothetical protein
LAVVEPLVAELQLAELQAVQVLIQYLAQLHQMAVVAVELQKPIALADLVVQAVVVVGCIHQLTELVVLVTLLAHHLHKAVVVETAGQR